MGFDPAPNSLRRHAWALGNLCDRKKLLHLGALNVTGRQRSTHDREDPRHRFENREGSKVDRYRMAERPWPNARNSMLLIALPRQTPARRSCPSKENDEVPRMIQ